MSTLQKTQVLIVGAGPTGLMAANQLMRFGVDFIVIDPKAGPTQESRAIAVTARSLEIYQQLGLSNIALEQGTRIRSLNLYSQGKKKGNVNINEIGKGLSEFHYMLAFEQSKNEELLYKNLKDQNREVNWDTEFLELNEYTNEIVATAKKNGETFQINAQYLIACDGARSPVRHQLNFSFEGGTYANKFFVADTVLNWDLEYDKLIVNPGDKNFCAFLPLKGDRCYRVLGTLPKSYSENEHVTFDDIQKVIIETLGLKLNFEKINWFSIYKLHHRCVTQFSQGRVFLAGDSAHVHSPAGGQGMNTGLQDAYNISWKLAFVLKKYANAPLLETYNEERLPFARWLIKFTDRGFNLMTNDNWFIRFFRKYIVLNIAGWIIRSKRIQARVFRTVSQIWYSYNGKSLSRSLSRQKLRFGAGDRLPFIDSDNSQDNFYTSFADPCFHLLYIGNESLSEDAKRTIPEVFPFPVKIVERSLTNCWQKLGITKQLFILVRPDNYIAFISDNFDEHELHPYLAKYFNSTESRGKAGK